MLAGPGQRLPGGSPRAAATARPPPVLQRPIGLECIDRQLTPRVAGDDVGDIHPKAMPVILTTAKGREVWMGAGVGRGEGPAAPLPDSEMAVIDRGGKRDLTGGAP